MLSLLSPRLILSHHPPQTGVTVSPTEVLTESHHLYQVEEHSGDLESKPLQLNVRDQK